MQPFAAEHVEYTVLKERGKKYRKKNREGSKGVKETERERERERREGDGGRGRKIG
jgi:hypothetical protein